jgi:hypothetical protein
MFKRLRSFPEFQDLQSLLSDLQANEARLVEAESRVFGADYDTFAASQPNGLSHPLRDLSSTAKRQIQVRRDMAVAGATLPARLQQLAGIQGEITSAQSALRAAELANAPDAIKAARAGLAKAKAAVLQALADGLRIDAEDRRNAVYNLCELVPEMKKAVAEFALSTDPTVPKLQARLQVLERELLTY